MTEYIRIGKRGTVVIPSQLRREYGLSEGDMLALEPGAEGLLLKPTRTYDVEIYTPERFAEFRINNTGSAAEWDEAVAEVRASGIDPDTLPIIPRWED